MQEERGPYIYSNEEVKAAIHELFGYPQLLQGMKAFLPEPLYEMILQKKDEVNSVEAFQEQIIYPVMELIQKSSISALSASGFEHLDPSRHYLFISNHRDIILDSAFLNTVLYERGFGTGQIAIGDNLMRHRISELIFHANKSFVVKRSGTPMELYRYSLLLSAYIRQQITAGTDSIWIAQREGRAKDGDDRTQPGLLKMLSLSNQGDLKTCFRELRIVPVSISYEYDPCDQLKAQEFLNKRRDPSYKKTFEEDLQHMLLGLKGQKGGVHFHFSAPLDAELDLLDSEPLPKKQLELLAGLIDRQIHLHYRFFPVNYLAHDLLSGRPHFHQHYEGEILPQLEHYFEKRFKQLQHDGEGQGREYLLKMYANPMINHLAALETTAY